MTKKQQTFCLFIFLFTLSGHNFAWWSAEIGDMTSISTHYRLTKKAIDEMPTEYADIKRFGEKIALWTAGLTDDANAHGKKVGTEEHPDARQYNGGPYGIWWYDVLFPNVGVLTKYKQHNFSNSEFSAYYYISLMTHLIADQAVPAHAANILHGSPIWQKQKRDNVEQKAYSLLQTIPSNVPPIIKNDTLILNRLKKYYYYENRTINEFIGSIPLTQEKLPFWHFPEGTMPNYWVENPNANIDDNYKYKGQNFYDKWGHYGFNDPI